MSAFKQRLTKEFATIKRLHLKYALLRAEVRTLMRGIDIEFRHEFSDVVYASELRERVKAAITEMDAIHKAIDSKCQSRL